MEGNDFDIDLWVAVVLAFFVCIVVTCLTLYALN